MESDQRDIGWILIASFITGDSVLWLGINHSTSLSFVQMICERNRLARAKQKGNRLDLAQAIHLIFFPSQTNPHNLWVGRVTGCKSFGR